MKRGLYLSIPSPCKESWDEMVAVEHGRFCNNCQKMVIDFTQFTDEQLLAYFKGREDAVCGHFRNVQLRRQLQPMTPQSRIIPMLVLTAGMLMLSDATIAQQHPSQVKSTVIHNTQASKKKMPCKAISKSSVKPACDTLQECVVVAYAPPKPGTITGMVKITSAIHPALQTIKPIEVPRVDSNATENHK
ncbi:MAG: hypothetical protein JO154_17065 [Chitinophaga sp.]|uniref:hypothetical protein n=1 Tax=Chitinophaga sp. TaxID=1869181 RepID=UPI0025C705F2|nr:hypothetical protein [Chitinophaga sp.]MBV8254313.1 hypothetical protein [Chitinophaga sp.]